ncbi:MAG: YkgJ family cysteine cluster protein [Parcubacteria group bacterium]
MNSEIYTGCSIDKTKIARNIGSISACKACSGLDCCGLLTEGGIIEPPYLLKRDIEDIEYYTGLSSDAFAAKKLNPRTGNFVFIMKTNERGGCVFFNQRTGLCDIYNCRPVDCRLFPLDIRLIDNRYYWALFRYPKCHGSISDDLKYLLDFRTQALFYLADELMDYATFPVPGMEKIGYTILEELSAMEKQQ